MSGTRVRVALLRWGPAVAGMVALFWFSSLPDRPPTPGMEGIQWDDKLQHTLAYAVLAGCFWHALGGGLARWRRAVLVIVMTAAYGASDEFHQSFVPGRSCSVIDWLADSSGGIAMSLILATRDRRRWSWQTTKSRRRTSK